MDNLINSENRRYEVPPHPVGLTGVDHVAIAASDPVRAACFYIDVLCGSLYCATGFSEEERRQGKTAQCLIHMGSVLIQIGYPTDGRSFPDPDNVSHWPHVAFGATAPALDAMRDQLERHGIPLSGPWSHLALHTTSVYFMDTEGNKLEICTWEPYPKERTRVINPASEILRGQDPLIRRGGDVDWPGLVHHWRPSAERWESLAEHAVAP